MKAYIATAEYAELICAFDKNPAKALKKIAKKYSEVASKDGLTMLTGVNVGYDDEGFYYITATISTMTV